MPSQARHKIHLFKFNEHQAIPASHRSAYESAGLKGTLCRRVGKTSTYPTDVVCKRCLKLMQMASDSMRLASVK